MCTSIHPFLSSKELKACYSSILANDRRKDTVNTMGCIDVDSVERKCDDVRSLATNSAAPAEPCS
jgi:hypothetical protein